MSESLSKSESDLLVKCEQIIGESIDTFRQVGWALAVIKSKALYRHDFKSFEAYVAGRWPFTRRHAARLIDAAVVAREVESRADGPKVQLADAATAAELKAVPRGQRKAVFDSAAKLALEAGTSVRVRHIKSVIKSLQDPKTVEAAPAPVAEKHAPIINVKAQKSCEVDLEGNPLPDDIPIREAFAARNWFDRILNTLQEAMDEVESLAGRKPGTWLDKQSVVTAIRNASHEVSIAMPHAVCPCCKGAPPAGNCHRCKGLGWVSKHAESKQRSPVDSWRSPPRELICPNN